VSPKLLLATRNPAKVREYSSLFQGAPFWLTTLAEEGINVEVSETGHTLEENARIKAAAYAAGNQFLGICEGECSGIIAFEPRGDHGFGYDPVFYLPELGKTMAELSLEEKNRVSHRGKAVQKALQFLESLWEETRKPK
jgi:inosine/xanthosine triphosphate pyrophosphatase family protein